MDLNLDYSDDESPLSLKSDFILSLCELIVAAKRACSPVQKTIIDRCVRLVYQTYLNDPRPENMPILEDLYNLLRAQEEKEAQYNRHGAGNLCDRLPQCVQPSEQCGHQQPHCLLRHQGAGQAAEENRYAGGPGPGVEPCHINRAAHKSTRYYIDEMHLLLKEEQTAAYTVEIWKRFRKWGGIPTGITLNV